MDRPDPRAGFGAWITPDPRDNGRGSPPTRRWWGPYREGSPRRDPEVAAVELRPDLLAFRRDQARSQAEIRSQLGLTAAPEPEPATAPLEQKTPDEGAAGTAASPSP